MTQYATMASSPLDKLTLAMTGDMPDHETNHVAIDGRCLCGAVRYRVEGERSGMIVCHCGRCRKHMGSAYVHFVVFDSGAFTWIAGKEHLVAHPSAHSPDGRSFCDICGTSMPGPSKGGDRLGNILAGHSLDMPPADLIYHVYTASKCPWTEIPQGAQQWKTVPPHFLDPELPELDRYSAPGLITGSCLCGEVAFQATEPIVMINCHCSRCRLARGSAHATNLFVAADGFRWRTGADHVVIFKLPEADRFGTAFCQQCGSLLPRGSGSRPDRVNVPVGCLDSDPGIVPRGHIYVGSKAPWHEITDSLPQWESTLDSRIRR